MIREVPTTVPITLLTPMAEINRQLLVEVEATGISEICFTETSEFG